MRISAACDEWQVTRRSTLRSTVMTVLSSPHECTRLGLARSMSTYGTRPETKAALTFATGKPPLTGDSARGMHQKLPSMLSGSRTEGNIWSCVSLCVPYPY